MAGLSIGVFPSFPLIAVAGLALGGCNVLPSGGPDAVQISTTQGVETQTAVPYVIVPVGRAILPYVSVSTEPVGLGSFADRRPSPDLTLGVGDIVFVRIFEASPGGLFTAPESSGSRPGNYAEVQNQEIDKHGDISVPYAGVVHAAGKTAAEVGKEIESRIGNRAIEPQAIVTLVERHSAQISVLGLVNQPGSFSLLPKGERVLDGIAHAQGLKILDYEAYITLQRHGRKATASFSSLISNPANNIYLQPDDVIFVARQQRTFTALGASGQNSQVDFGADRVTLAEAIGKAGGLLDSRANPSQVYVFRMEDRNRVSAMGFDPSRFAGPVVPTIYKVNMYDPGGVFVAANFQMRMGDVLYISNAPFTAVVKVLSVVTPSALVYSYVRHG
jgi:polysaccharide export outer membrane protein